MASNKSAAAWQLPTFDEKTKTLVLHEDSLKMKKTTTFGHGIIKWCVLTTECLLFYSGNEDKEADPGKMKVNILTKGPSSRGELTCILPLIGENISLVEGNEKKKENIWNTNLSSQKPKKKYYFSIKSPERCMHFEALSKTAYKRWRHAIKECLEQTHTSTLAVGKSGHKWANRVNLITVETVLNDEQYHSMFREFLVSIHKHEVLSFWDACEKYKALHVQPGPSTQLITLIDILENDFLDDPLEVEGIYRISGDKTKITSLIELLQKDEEYKTTISKQVVENKISMHEITGLIKNYLRTMEEPLLLFKFYNDFISIGKKVTHINKFNSTKNASS